MLNRPGTHPTAETSQRSLSDGDAEARTTHSGSLSDGDAEARTTHSGSLSEARLPAPPRRDGVTSVDDFGQSLSPDAQLLLDLIRTGGSWDAGTLCEMTEMRPTRLAWALVDLEFAHLVTRGMFGVFEAAKGKGGRGHFKKAGWRLDRRGGGKRAAVSGVAVSGMAGGASEIPGSHHAHLINRLRIACV